MLERDILARVAKVLLARAGLRIGPDGYAGLRLAVKARLDQLHLTRGAEYAKRLERDDTELRALLPLVTIGKTDFFRDEYQFRALKQTVLPWALAQAQRERRRVKLWSAGCASGEEPYSLAMLALESGATPAEVSILGTDVNDAAITTAQRGRYEERRLVGLSSERMQRFMRPEDRLWLVSDEVKAFVRFATHNLAGQTWEGRRAQSVDVIFCRNVIIYFDDKTTLAVVERFFETLRPGGWLFLGYSESLFKVCTRFQMVEADGAFLYRRPPLTPAGVKIDKLPPPQPNAPSGGVVSAKEAESSSLAPVHALLERGEFAQAEPLLAALVAREPRNLEAWLTLGNVHALKGDIAQARRAYLYVSERSPLSLEPHLYSALAALQAGELRAAHKALMSALFLDPTLALGYLMLGQVFELMGDVEGASAAYHLVLAQRGKRQRELKGFFPELPRCCELAAQAATHRLAGLQPAPSR